MEASPRHNDRAPTLVATKLLAAQPDAVLCRLAARGNIGAYDALYERYRAPLVAFVFHVLGRGGSAEDAEDIAQDAFTRAFTGIREKHVDGSFKAWLYTIARNRTYDQMRARRENVVSLDAESVVPPSAPDHDGPVARAEQRAELIWLMGAVAELPERQREALLLKEMGGLSHDRIADELGTTVSATKKLISRGREGIDQAATAGGFGRPRRLGRDLALAAPVLPLTVSLATLGVTAGTGASAAAAGSMAAGAAAGTATAGVGAATAGKVAATALAVVAIGGGTVAVENRRSAPEPAAQTQSASALENSDRSGAGQGPQGVTPSQPGQGNGAPGEGGPSGEDGRGLDDNGARELRAGEFDDNERRGRGRGGEGRDRPEREFEPDDDEGPRGEGPRGGGPRDEDRADRPEQPESQDSPRSGPGGEDGGERSGPGRDRQPGSNSGPGGGSDQSGPNSGPGGDD